MVIQKADAGLKRIERMLVIGSWLATLFVAGMLIIDIFLRAVFNQPLPASWEISEVAMSYICMLGFACALTTNVHVRVSMVIDRLAPKPKLFCRILSNAISFPMCALITIWSWLRFWESFLMNEEILAAIKIPFWVGKFVMPVAFLMLTVRYLLMIIQDLTGNKPAEVR
jgi:TRAP-type C4-dicarboxylate transport system permease small subunit